MLDLLPSTHELNDEYNKKSNLIWKGKLVCLLLFNERRLSLASIASYFTETVCGIPEFLKYIYTHEDYINLVKEKYFSNVRSI